jgi:hypothetical protein
MRPKQVLVRVYLSICGFYLLQSVRIKVDIRIPEDTLLVVLEIISFYPKILVSFLYLNIYLLDRSKYRRENIKYVAKPRDKPLEKS